jgi:metal-responsive CopG/Arc/MetJ family transcriptional regulator
MFGRTRIAIDDRLLARLRKWAERSGYSSAEELIAHVLEREVAHLEGAATEDELRARLKGLGYLS